MGKRAAIYARVSTDEQTKGYSLPTQVEACRNYCADKSYEVVGEFQDDCTGTELERPGLNALRAAAADGALDVVVVHDIDRLARNVYFQLHLERELASAGVKIEYVLGQYEDTPEGNLLKRIKADIAEYENAQRAERSRRGKEGRVRAGYVLLSDSHVPFGYDYVSEPHKGYLVINEEQAVVVRQIYHWATEDSLSAWGIARKLSELGILTQGDLCPSIPKKSKRGQWSSTTVVGMLRNTVYKGIWYYGKTRVQRVNGKMVQVPMPESEWIGVPVPAIVDEATWERAQRALERSKREAKRNVKRNYLLRGMVFCQCGRRRTGLYRRELDRGYYQCPGGRDHPSGNPCSQRKSIRQEPLERVVWEAVTQLLLDPENLRAEMVRRREQAQELHRAHLEQLDKLESQIQDIDRKMGILLDYLLNGTFPESVIEERKRDLLARQRQLEAEAKRIKSDMEMHTLTPKQEEEILAFAKRVSEGLTNASFEEKRRILELIDLRVDVIDDQTVKLSGIVAPGEIANTLS